MLSVPVFMIYYAELTVVNILSFFNYRVRMIQLKSVSLPPSWPFCSRGTCCHGPHSSLVLLCASAITIWCRVVE